MNCENCNNIHNKLYGSGRFCSEKCSRSFSTKNKRSEINEKVSEKLKRENYKKCLFCASQTINRKSNYCLDCKKYTQNINLFKKLDVYRPNTKLSLLNNIALDILNKEYFIDKNSKLVIMKKYNLMSNTIYNFFKKNGISLRSLSEATTLSIIENRASVININNQYLCGYHESWNGKKFYYRSSYELEYCKYLDSLCINYKLNGDLKIKYYDTIKKAERVAIPDILLIDNNTIIEIKSTYTFDKINMIDKVKSYIKNGYNFKLILDKEDKTDLILNIGT
jgi:hypothetical protein